MIARPLDLQARLRPAPRFFDTLYYVNVAVLGVFFALFGSRYVLAPGLGIDLPRMPGAVEQATVTTVVINVPAPDTAIVDDAVLPFSRLEDWLRVQAARTPGSVLLIRADLNVPLRDLVPLSDMALRAGFARVQLAAEEPAAPKAAFPGGLPSH